MGVRTMKHTDTLTRATWDIAHRDISFTLEGNAVTNGFIDEASYVNLAEINADTLDFTFDNANKNIQVNKGDVGDDLTNIMKITGSANLINKYIVDQSYSSGQAQFQIVAQANDIISFALKTEAISDLDLRQFSSIFDTTGFEFLNNRFF